jgi:ATP-binding cassette subfamily F protein 3
VRRDQRRLVAAERERLAKARRPVQVRLDATEQRLHETTRELKDLDTQLASEAFYTGDANAVSDALKRRGELERQVQRLETQWFELQSEMDAIV